MSGIHHHIEERISGGEPPVRVWREQAALTISELAKRSGVSRERLLAIETGNAVGDGSELVRIAAVFGIDASDLHCPSVIDDEIPW